MLNHTMKIKKKSGSIIQNLISDLNWFMGKYRLSLWSLRGHLILLCVKVLKTDPVPMLNNVWIRCRVRYTLSIITHMQIFGAFKFKLLSSNCRHLIEMPGFYRVSLESAERRKHVLQVIQAISLIMWKHSD